MKSGEVLLNASILRNRVAELQLKQWWIAERLGVDRKTVSRWLSGKVRSAKAEHVEGLAAILECQVDELTLRDASEHLASPEDQRRAAELLSSSAIIDKLGPIGEWNVIEALLKASIVPNLPALILGELLNRLSEACWRQSKIEEAAAFAGRAEEIGRRIGDQSILAQAWLSQANIYGWRGEVANAIGRYRDCVELQDHVDPGKIAAALSNLGALLWETGELEASETTQRSALQRYENLDGGERGLSVAHCQLAFVMLEKEDLEQAAHHISESVCFASACGYLRGLEMGKLTEAVLYALKRQPEAATRLASEGLNGFSRLGIEEGFNYLFAGRACRLVERHAQAETYLAEGMRLARKYPLEEAAIHYESGLNAAASSRMTEAVGHLTESKRIFSETGAMARVRQVQDTLESLNSPKNADVP